MIHPDLLLGAAQYDAEIPVSDLWVLMARSQLWEQDGWLSRWLWTHRWASFILSAEGYCRCCGAALSGWARGDAVYCGGRCRQRAYRARASDKLTPFGEAVQSAREDLEQLEADLVGFRSWYRQSRSASIMPPDLLRIDHLPVLPGRCGRGCARGVGCRHTDGGPCLFGNTCRSSRDG